MIRNIRGPDRCQRIPAPFGDALIYRPLICDCRIPHRGDQTVGTQDPTLKQSQPDNRVRKLFPQIRLELISRPRIYIGSFHVCN